MASKKRTASTSLQSQSHVGAVGGDDQVDCETVNVENNDSGSDGHDSGRFVILIQC
ncbi:Uncharacterized protein APZ42_003442 [Daphnia magna]|uniref:Uncharacterized protein n=1 Tax=Daphnia magna TaxID=35525 RepID=A0A0P5KRQ8_9CRUS|nr:Uncharacterized protein APZ42_003442 [Daphnia magna]